MSRQEPPAEFGEVKIVKKTFLQGLLAGKELVHPQSPERTTNSAEVRKMVEKHRDAGGKIIYEVGFGGLFCANLDKYDVSIGVDPMFSHKSSAKTLSSDQYSERLYFNQQISELPEDTFPDFVLMVAPSPESIEEMLNELESKVNSHTRFIFAIENQSRNAVEGGADEAIIAIKKFLNTINKTNIEVVNDASDLDTEFDVYLQDGIGLKQGGKLRTSPWQPSGEWKIVTSR